MNNKRLTIKVAQGAKDDYKPRAKTPEYSPHLDEEVLDYTPHPEEQSSQ